MTENQRQANPSEGAHPVGDAPSEGSGGNGAANAVAICRAIVRSAHLIDRFANGRLPSFGVPAGLSMPRVRLLLAVHEAGRPRMSDVAWDLGVTARTITTMVDALEDEGVLVRQPDASDRRAILLQLTPHGEAQVETIERAFAAIGEAVLAPLAPADRAELRRLLTRLIERDEGDRG